VGREIKKTQKESREEGEGKEEKMMFTIP